jgi:hypothetical protein
MAHHIVVLAVIVDRRKDRADHRQPRAALVVGADDRPGRVRGVAKRQRLADRVGIGVPAGSPSTSIG